MLIDTSHRSNLTHASSFIFSSACASVSSTTPHKPLNRISKLLEIIFYMIPYCIYLKFLTDSLNQISLLNVQCVLCYEHFCSISSFNVYFQLPLYPTVGLQTPGEVVEANFGQLPFIFDIEDYMKV